MRKVKNVSFYIELCIYNYNLLFVVGDVDYFRSALTKQYRNDISGIDDFIEGLDLDEDDDREGIHYHVNIVPDNVKHGYSESIIWLKSWEWTINDYCVLIHEILHHCFDVFKQVHIEVSAGNDETLTYYSTFVYRKCLKELNKYYRSKK